MNCKQATDVLNFSHPHSVDGQVFGNVRSVITPDANNKPVVTQANDYFPFGMSFESPIPNLSYKSTTTNKHKYNGKEEQEMPGNWLDYGARFYDPTLGRFHTQDRFAENYLDLTPYQYAGNNPILYIDVNGDSIAIGGLIDRIAGFFGYKTKYVKKVEADIDAAKKDDPAVKQMIEDLEDSPRLHRIEPTDSDNDGNSVTIDVNKAKKGTKQETTINYNPDKKTSGKGNKGDRRTPRVGLVHELQHSSDADKGTLNFKKTSTGIPMYEVDAVNMENKTRAKTGDKKRTTYGGRKIPNKLLK